MNHFAIYMTLLASCLAAREGCSAGSVTSRGFSVNVFNYPLNTPDGWEAGFFTEGYKKFGSFSRIDGVQNCDFSVVNDVGAEQVVEGQIYGSKVTTTNYTMELSGFYQATQSGQHTFEVRADNGASFQLGTGSSCSSDALGCVTTNLDLTVLGPNGGGGSVDRNVETASIELEKGIFYPVKVVFFSWRQSGGLKTKIQLPDGTELNDIGTEIVQLNVDGGDQPDAPVGGEENGEKDGEVNDVEGFRTFIDERGNNCVVYKIEEGEGDSVQESEHQPETTQESGPTKDQ